MNTKHIVDTATKFADVFNYELAYEIAPRLTRTEVEALAALLRATDYHENSTVWLESWIEQEIEDGECELGDWIVGDDGLVHAKGDN